MPKPTALNVPPLPASTAEVLRVEHSRLRRRIIYSMHEEDVRARLVTAVGSTRAAAWAKSPDMTCNPAWYVTSQLAALYNEVPEVTPPPGGEAAAAALVDGSFWQLSRRLQRDTLAMNDMFMRVDVDEDGPYWRMVFPDMTEPTADRRRPGQPAAMVEWVEDPDDEAEWIKLVTDPRERIYKALDKQGNDISDRVLGRQLSGDAYPFLVEGQPVLNYVAYHAAEAGCLLDPYTGREVFDGGLNLGVYYSYFGHVLRNVAWAQRYAIGAAPVGAEADENGRRQELITDPAVLVLLKALEGHEGQPVVGQWGSPVDPEKVLAGIERYERRIVESALGSAGVSRRQSDVRSAMSLAVSRESQRAAQRAYEPVFRASDRRLLALVSGLMGLPTEGWSIRYRAIPRDPAELASEAERIAKLVDANLEDRVTAYRTLHPGMTAEEARAAVSQIAEINRRFAA